MLTRTTTAFHLPTFLRTSYSRPRVGLYVAAPYNSVVKTAYHTLAAKVRKPSDKDYHWVYPTKTVEENQKIASRLVALGLTFKGFNLKHVTNTTRFSEELHSALDRDLLAITVSLETGKKVIDVLAREISLDQAAVDGNLNTLYDRAFYPPIKISIPKFDLQSVVLKPYHLPTGTIGSSRQDNWSYTPKHLILQAQSILEHLDDPHFTDPNSINIGRNTNLNIWFLLINAEEKFQRFKKMHGLEALHPSMREIAQQTIRIVDLMYSSPKISEDFYKKKVTAALWRRFGELAEPERKVRSPYDMRGPGEGVAVMRMTGSGNLEFRMPASDEAMRYLQRFADDAPVFEDEYDDVEEDDDDDKEDEEVSEEAEDYKVVVGKSPTRSLRLLSLD